MTHDRFKYWFFGMFMQFVFMVQMVSKYEVSPRKMPLFRGLLSDCVNTAYAAFILITLPIFLARSGTAIDFVKDSFAVTFISALDDDSLRNLTFVMFRGRVTKKDDSKVLPAFYKIIKKQQVRTLQTLAGACVRPLEAGDVVQVLEVVHNEDMVCGRVKSGWILLAQPSTGKRWAKLQAMDDNHKMMRELDQNYREELQHLERMMEGIHRKASP